MAHDVLSEDETRELNRLLDLSTVRAAGDYKRMADLSARKGDVPGEREVLLAQYQTLRQETMNSTNNRVHVLLFGAVVMAVLIGAASAVNNPPDHKTLVFALFSGAIPLAWIFVLVVWLSEAIRAHRVAAFLASDAEARLNLSLGKLAVTWDATLSTAAQPRDEWGGPSMVALLVLGLLAGASPLFGFMLAGESLTPRSSTVAWLAVPYGMLLLAAGYVVSLMPRLRNVNSVRSVWPGAK